MVTLMLLKVISRGRSSRRTATSSSSACLSVEPGRRTDPSVTVVVENENPLPSLSGVTHAESVLPRTQTHNRPISHPALLSKITRPCSRTHGFFKIPCPVLLFFIVGPILEEDGPTG